MGARTPAPGALDDVKIHVRFKISALWAAVMFCYIYGDFFGLFEPGQLAAMMAGRMAGLGAVTQGGLLGVAMMMAIPGSLVFLALVMPPRACRWVNIAFGALFTLIMLITMRGAWAFYLALGAIEMALTLLIVWYAWTWPRQAPQPAAGAEPSVGRNGAL